MRAYILLLIILVTGCSRKNEYENIEVLTYSWTHGDYENVKDEFYISCSTYSSIDKSGKAITYSNHSYSTEKSFYFINQIDENSIDSIISLIKSVKNDSIDRKIYDGPCIKVRINFKSHPLKIYTFPMKVRDMKFQPLRNLYHSFVNPTEMELLGKQEKLDRMKDIFISDAMQLDTLSVPLPKKIATTDNS